MASFLQKFVRGAAGAGASLYADQASQQLRASLQAKRDSVLERNRSAQQAGRQKFEREQAAARNKQRAASPEGKLAAIKLKKAEKMESLSLDYENATTQEGKLKAVKGMMLASGRPAEMRGATGKASVQGLTLVSNLYKSMVAEQSEALLSEEDKKSTAELFETAYTMVEDRIREGGGIGPGKKPKAKSTVTGTIKRSDLTEEQRRKLFKTKQGDLINLGGGKWLTVID